jgi:hypothetical protein
VDSAISQFGDEIVHSLGHDDLGCSTPCPARSPNDTAQRRYIEVVHVSVGYQDKVDGRHLLDQNPGLALATQQDEPGSEDRIDQNVSSTDLEKKGGVSDEGDTELTWLYKLCRPGFSPHRLLVAFAHKAPELAHLGYGKWPSSPKPSNRALPRTHSYVDALPSPNDATGRASFGIYRYKEFVSLLG